jgi:hypothetical protein
MKRFFVLSCSVWSLVSCNCDPARACQSSVDCAENQICAMGTCQASLPINDSGVAIGGGTAGQGGGAGSTGGGSSTGGGGGGTGGGLIEPDAGVDPDYDGGCGPPMPGNPSIRRQCVPPVDSECGGPSDALLSAGGVPSTRLNGNQGNGFDDDCDGLVDEGCFCPSNGVTKDCYLVPATQVDPSTGLPVGWCSANAKGSVDCSGGELAAWSGVCRGAQPPSLTDSCSPGDFNCDGLDSNNAARGCMCPSSVQCPTQAITTAPYPDPRAIPKIDGSAWVAAADRSRTTNWTWTVLGGDCDNVLPFPTFALYRRADSTSTNSYIGRRQAVELDATQTPARFVPQNNSPLIGMRAANFGNGAAGGEIFPAFGLSGDYIVQGEFTLDGQSYSCTQKVQVRAPGIRAELCWDTVGGINGTNGTDIDLHFARLQGITCANRGWARTCVDAVTGAGQDCYYNPASGCANRNPDPQWGYANSPDTACRGWSSRRTSVCTNPRLDRDNVTCDRNNPDPTGMGFCGPENINLDQPNDGDAFVVGVNHYDNTGATEAKPHVNLYCNGERVLSVGYNPATGQTQFPLLNTAGRDTSGDFWTVATIKANVTGGNLTSCTVTTIPSRVAQPLRDGMPAAGGTGSDICVDHAYQSRRFVDANSASAQGVMAGGQPTTALQWCKH